jgi:Reverse transcriptase (RNA-dependent DNA polymerase)
LYIDYRGLYNITIKNRYVLSLISEFLNRFKSALIFIKLDVRGVYNLLRIASGHKWKIAFRTRYIHFEYQVMPSDLANAPALFQALLNDILRFYLDIFVMVYLDDILIFSSLKLEHDTHITSSFGKT